MLEFKSYEIGGFAININAIAFIQDKGKSIVINFIGGSHIEIPTQISAFLMGIKTVK
jgi:hypothetical protein